MKRMFCLFDGEDGEFFGSVISPLTACETYFTVNETHVQFTNTISSMETGKTYPLGVVVGPQKTANVLSAFISCTHRIDLRVSTLFFRNITVIPIRVPKTFGDGEFKVAMSLYTDATYRTPYIDPPTLQADEVLFVGVNIVNEASPDVYLLIEKCWGTTTDDADGIPSYPLIDDGCPIANKGNNEIKITQNGISHQSLWRAPVFKLSEEMKTIQQCGFIVTCKFVSTESVSQVAKGEENKGNNEIKITQNGISHQSLW